MLRTFFIALVVFFVSSIVHSTEERYTPDYIRMLTKETEHGFFDYLRRLGISEQEVNGAKGKKWLSVGEGRSNFVYEAAKRGVDSHALDAVVRNPFAPERTTIGLSQNLPFSDQSFDRVVSVWLMDYFFDPKAFNDPEAGKKSLVEMIRVTKIGGDIRISPIQQGAILSFLDELKTQEKIQYEVLPYYKGSFLNKEKHRIFEIEPLNQTKGSVRITRLK